jgi:hypothetical protein
VHLTTRIEKGLWNLRCPPIRRTLEGVFEKGSDRFGFRLIHYSVQATHFHLIAEASDRRALWRGVKGLLVRAAKALNKLGRRKGRVFADRYHAHQLRTPREVRNALVYVLHNAFHHGVRVPGIDVHTSGRWFDGWTVRIEAPRERSPCVSAWSWLLRFGWRRHGLVPPRPVGAEPIASPNDGA